jgi:choline monooxygenase
MFHHDTKLDHVLPPSAYTSADYFERERADVFGNAWHFAGLTEDVAQDGDYLAVDAIGVPVVCRNVHHEIRAFRNVCLHRHSQIAPLGKGSSKTLRCQYHGWEYGEEGQVAKIPDGVSFKGIRAKELCLDRYRVDHLGSLLFTNLDGNAAGLRESIGSLAPELDYFFGNHKMIWRWVDEYPVNWKIIVENAVESYHVPLLHPGTFADYKEERFHDHVLNDAYTSYLDIAPMGSSIIERGLKTLTRMMAPTIHFERAKHVHIFPNLMFYVLELYSIFSTVEPLGPERTRFTSVGFLPRNIRMPFVNRPIQNLFRVELTRMLRRITNEDKSIWREVQSGLRHSKHAGVLSRREERVYAFQNYLAARTGIARSEMAVSQP